MEIKETKEVVKGFIKLAALLAEAFKDGVQAEDAAVVLTKIQSDAVLKQALLDAYNDADKVPLEIKELSLAEGIELAVVILQAAPELVNALKKQV